MGVIEGFISDAIPVMRTVTMGVLIMSVATVWLNGVTGTGNTKINLAIEIITIILYTIYIYLVLQVWNIVACLGLGIGISLLVCNI